MPDVSPQNLANHKRLVAGYHFVAAGLLLVNLIFAVWTLIRGFSVASMIGVTTAVALFLVGFYARAFALAVQDRVIRLEERLRFDRLLPPDLRSRARELSVGQLVALRFASDEELPGLTRRVLDERLTDREAIKKLIVTWRPDDLRV